MEQFRNKIENNDDETLLLVKGSSGDKRIDSDYVKKLATAILQVFYKHGKVKLRSVGAAAGNNAEKSLIIARGEAYKRGDILASIPDFCTVIIAGSERTGIVKEVINIKELSSLN